MRVEIVGTVSALAVKEAKMTPLTISIMRRLATTN